MRGFIAGSLALIVLYVVVQPGAAARAATGGGVLVDLLQRAISPQVAAIHDRSNVKKDLAQSSTVGAAGGQVLNQLPNLTGN